MNATSLYVTTSRLVLQQSHDCSSDQNWTDLYRLVPYLRQSLSCTVCGRMLIEPYKPSDGKCQHHICRGCIRGRKNLKPTCCWCRDNFNLDKYEENTQMRILLQCYKSLCQYIMNTPMYQIINKQTNHTGTINLISNGVAIPNASLMEFIEEGACFQDNFKSNSGLTKSAYSILPCVFTNNQQSTSTSIPLSTITSTTATTTTTMTTTLPAAASISTSQHQQITTSTIFNRQQSPALTTTTTTTTTNILPTPSPPGTSLLKPSAVAAAAALSSTNQQYHQQLLHIHQKSTNNNNIHKNIQNLSNNITTSGLSTFTSGITTTTTSNYNNSHKKLHNMTPTSSIASTSNQQQQQHLINKLQNCNNRNVINVVAPPLSPMEQPKINTVVSTPTTVQISNPPPIKTVSNGSAMYSVLYTGVGNKITIKRKTDGDDDSSSKKYPNLLPPPARIVLNKTINGKRRGCRCGNATATPGKLTCCGQRCPCYVDSKSCIDCKCRGCRNPHRPDGCKIRPMIPELACYEIQMADDNTNITTTTGSTGVSLLSGKITTQQSPFNQINNNNYGTQSNIPNINSNNILHKKQSRVEMSLEDFNSTNLSNLISTSNNNATLLNGMISTSTAITTAPTLQTIPTSNNSTNTTTHHVIPMLKKPPPLQTTTTYTFATKNQINRMQSVQNQQSQQPHQTVKLENAPRESLLIKSADGKYQVVNVYTTTPHQTINPQQRYHTIQTSTIGSNYHQNNNTTTINTISGLQFNQNRNINQTSFNKIPEISTTLPQLLLQPQHQPQINNTTTLLTTTNDINTFHQQQQHHFNNLMSSTSSTNQKQQHSSTPTSMTLVSPIIVSATHNQSFSPDLFDDEDDDDVDDDGDVDDEDDDDDEEDCEEEEEEENDDDADEEEQEEEEEEEEEDDDDEELSHQSSHQLLEIDQSTDNNNGSDHLSV